MDIQLAIESKTARDLRGINPGEMEILFERGKKFTVIKREGKRI